MTTNFTWVFNLISSHSIVSQIGCSPIHPGLHVSFFLYSQALDSLSADKLCFLFPRKKKKKIEAIGGKAAEFPTSTNTHLSTSIPFYPSISNTFLSTYPKQAFLLIFMQIISFNLNRENSSFYSASTPYHQFFSFHWTLSIKKKKTKLTYALISPIKKDLLLSLHTLELL